MIEALPPNTSTNVPKNSARYLCHAALIAAPRKSTDHARARAQIVARECARAARRRSSRVVSRRCTRVQVGEPDLHERPHRILETRFAGGGQGLLVALAHLGGIDPLLQPVVAR